MRRSPLLLVALFAVPACAHSPREEPRRPVASDGPPVFSAPEPPPPPEPAPAVRPRLSHTITLGHGDAEAYQPPPPRVETTAPSSTVVVNNTVVVQPPPAFYVYGAPFGEYGYSRGRAGELRSPGRSSAAGPPSSSGATGWEGARGTAAPGQTPGVGGNWSNPPSYGPAQLK